MTWSRPSTRPRASTTFECCARTAAAAAAGSDERLREEQMAQMTARTARVLIASTRAAAGQYEDRCGPIIVDWLRQSGVSLPAPVVVADGTAVSEALRAAIAETPDVVITSGGTGISPTDATPEATAGVLDYEIPGLADAIRRSGLPKVPTAVLSRGICGVAGRTLVINLPGSPGGVSDGLAVLAGVLDHALDQLRGKDHIRLRACSVRRSPNGPSIGASLKPWWQTKPPATWSALPG